MDPGSHTTNPVATPEAASSTCAGNSPKERAAGGRVAAGLCGSTVGRWLRNGALMASAPGTAVTYGLANAQE